MCQEADIQRHRQRMVNAGHIEDIARGSFGPKRTQTFEQSAKTFEVGQQPLSCIYSAPHACQPSLPTWCGCRH